MLANHRLDILVPPCKTLQEQAADVEQQQLLK